MAMKDGKIVVARLWPRYEGVVSSRASVISSINPRKYETIIIYLMKNSESPNFFEEEGYRVFYISRKKFFRLPNLLGIWKLLRVLKHQKVDILHSHGHKATIYGTIAAKLAGIHIVLSHVPGLNRSKRRRRKFMNWIVLRWVNKILTTGEAVRKDVLRNNPVVRPEQVIPIGNSIDYDRFSQVHITKQQAKENLAIKTDAFVFGTVGRLVPTKGYNYLIEAFTQVKQHLPSALLVFVGSGRLHNQLKEQAAESGFAEDIIFLGRRDDVPQLMRAMDVFVLSSVAEGMPRAMLEAMAAGVPCIATNVGGVAEILENGKFAMMAEANDTNALAKAMAEMTGKSVEEREELAAKAKQHVSENYVHEVVIEKLQSVYEQVRLEKNRTA